MILLITASARLKQLPLRGDDLYLLIFGLIVALIVMIAAEDMRNPWR